MVSLHVHVNLLYTNHLALVGQNLNEIKCDPNPYINHAVYLNWNIVDKQMDCSGVTGGEAGGMDCSGEAGGMDCYGEAGGEGGGKAGGIDCSRWRGWWRGW